VNAGPMLPAGARAVVLAAIVLVGIVIYFEIWRRYRRPGSITAAQFRRRLVGGVVLEIDLILWFIADVVTRGWRPAWQLLYLGGASLLIVVPMYLAVREWGFILRQYARSRSELVRSLGGRAQSNRNGDDGSG
jgi:hypothetical protein